MPLAPIVLNAEGYLAALERLKMLSKQPLGTPDTELVQELVDAILDYEARQEPQKAVPKKATDN